MNKIIQQLKAEAGIDYNPDQEGLDLFAKLIVEECLSIIDTSAINEDYTEWESGYNKALKKAKFDIKQILNDNDNT